MAEEHAKNGKWGFKETTVAAATSSTSTALTLGTKKDAPSPTPAPKPNIMRSNNVFQSLEGVNNNDEPSAPSKGKWAMGKKPTTPEKREQVPVSPTPAPVALPPKDQPQQPKKSYVNVNETDTKDDKKVFAPPPAEGDKKSKWGAAPQKPKDDKWTPPPPANTGVKKGKAW